ncbi:NAD-dependent epimerase/dehydratase family protein [Nitrosospira sp. Nsp1]|uniref:NAD-dependent epimerase/dehydratase family protein n=1 Tax=Nitrosospira sp. Nsp1 TaxID=136547 RepID=UPI00088D7759|nr:NAD-dependent epimerase/dehydratase family protein [Nitrosospira sp. Nsp1]SCX38430.1 Nucleoside-diphosphate-sugar epimerase [Nitrosospira sp. Nsp1]
MSIQKPLVLITGSEGRIGKAIARALGDSYTIIGFEQKCDTDTDCITVDISSDEAMSSGCELLRQRYGQRIASVIHLAAFYDFSDKPNPLYDEVNIQGTRRLLKALQAFDVEQFIYASTMLVHAPTQPGLPIAEDDALEPKWPYPKSKVAAENEVRTHHGHISFVIFRLAGVYTDWSEVPSLSTQIQRIYERQLQSHVFPGDPSHGQSFIHIDDVGRAFQQAVERRSQLPHEATILIGETATESYEGLQNLIGQLIHHEPWSTHQVPKTVAVAGAWLQNKMEDVVPDSIDRGIEPFVKPFMVALSDDHFELDISRAKTLLNWRPTHTLRETLPEIIGHLEFSPAEWYKRNKIPLPLWLEDVENSSIPSKKLIDDNVGQERSEHLSTLWCHFGNVALGSWLISSPFVFGLAESWMIAEVLTAPSGRGLPLSATWVTASDVVTGLLIVIFALLSLSRDHGWARWITALLGMWLLLAPLVFWTPSAAAYANDTLVGALVIIFAVGVPSASGVSPVARMTGPDAPPGWSDNPSKMIHRIPIIALAFVGLFLSRYMAAFQLGHIDNAWDPFFGAGTERIVTSEVSEAWPVADAGLGATVYVLEIVSGIIGDKRRWRTMPWMVLFFGILIVPLGAVSIYFIIIQPIIIGTWCTLCLAASAAMLLQIPYSFDEILATLQFMKERRQKGKSLWHVLWHGDTIENGSTDDSGRFDAPPMIVLREMLSAGIHFTWTMAVSIVIGISLMFTRVIFGTEAEAANSDHVIGSLVITFSIMALGEVALPLRFVNILFGAWLTVAPWVLTGYSGLASAAGVIAGVLLILLALPLAPIKNHYGAWDRWISIGPSKHRDGQTA